MANNEPAAPGRSFVRRCCILYVCALLGFWLLGIGESYYRSHRRNAAFSLNSLFLVESGDRFGDFTNFDPATGRFVRFTYFDKSSGHSVTKAVAPALSYPPAAEGVYILFAKVFPAPLWPYLIFIGVSIVIAGALLIRALTASGQNRWPLCGVVVITAMLCFPVMFLLERANFEGFVWVILALALTAFTARHYQTAALLFTLAAAMKLYPGVLLLLLVARKRYRELVLAAAALVVFVLLSLKLVGPTIPAAIREFRAGSAAVGASYLEFNYDTIRYDHSIFSAVKQLAFVYYENEHDAALRETLQAFAGPYMLLAACGFGLLYWFRIRHLPLLNQTTALILLAVTLPHVSFEYTLTHLIFTWALFLLFLVRDVATRHVTLSWKAARAILLCFAFLFAVGPFGLIAGQLKTCALLLLLVMVLAVPMPSSLFGENGPSSRAVLAT